ncbi:MAG: hypothetical protein ACN6OM_05770 [Alcaligenes nematophilus]|uniref:hypothetical protein n=1 Tax=Alcaligenes nematophilus TaxID=2994643 RepID=UPI003D03E43E
MNLIVIDKSYLKGSKAEEIKNLKDKYNLVIPSALIYESIKGTTQERSNLFKKFPEIENPYIVSDDIEKMIQYETKTKKPYTGKKLQEKDLSIHRQLIDPSFEFNESQNKTIVEKKIRIEEEAQLIIELAEGISIKFQDEIKKQNGKITTIPEEITSEDHIKNIYKEATKSPNCIIKNPIPVNKLNKYWVNFRFFQLYSILAWDIASRYPNVKEIKKSEKTLEKINHDILDCEILLTAMALKGSIAMKEKKWERYWEILKTKGDFIS